MTRFRFPDDSTLIVGTDSDTPGWRTVLTQVGIDINKVEREAAARYLEASKAMGIVVTRESLLGFAAFHVGSKHAWDDGWSFCLADRVLSMAAAFAQEKTAEHTRHRQQTQGTP